MAASIPGDYLLNTIKGFKGVFQAPETAACQGGLSKFGRFFSIGELSLELSPSAALEQAVMRRNKNKLNQDMFGIIKYSNS